MVSQRAHEMMAPGLSFEAKARSFILQALLHRRTGLEDLAADHSFNLRVREVERMVLLRILAGPLGFQSVRLIFDGAGC